MKFPFKRQAKEKEYVPTEYAEQCLVVAWLEQNGLKFTAIPNSTWTPSMAQKMKNYRSGVRAGLADLVIIIPKKPSLLFLEMKRTKHSVTSQAQKDWQEELNRVDNVECIVAKGAQEAIAHIKSLL